MPQTRDTELYKAGTDTPVLVGTESREISDEELYQEQLEAEFNDMHDQAIKLIKSWPTMNKDQKITAINKAFPKLVEWMLWKDGWLELGTLE